MKRYTATKRQITLAEILDFRIQNCFFTMHTCFRALNLIKGVEKNHSDETLSLATNILDGWYTFHLKRYSD